MLFKKNIQPFKYLKTVISKHVYTLEPLVELKKYQLPSVVI